MFDSSPWKVKPPGYQNEILTDALLGRLHQIRLAADASETGRTRRDMVEDKDRVLELVALWDAGAESLAESVDLVASWGPFELAETAFVSKGAEGRKRFICRFVYHGAARERTQFESCLREGLAQITKWEDGPEHELRIERPLAQEV